VRKGSRWGNPGRASKATRAPIFRIISAAGAAVVAAGFMAGCMDGGSDGIENPKVELQFQGPDGTTQGTGEIKVYARYMNPAEGDKPLLTKSFTGQAIASVSAEELDAVLKTALGKASLPDTTVDFNVLAVSGEREALVLGFRYKRAGSKLSFAQAPWKQEAAFTAELRRKVNLLDAVKGFKGTMGANGVSFGINYVYIPGSPYRADVVGVDASAKRGEFSFTRMGAGTYDLFGVNEESDTTFKSGDTLNTSDTAYTAKTWDIINIIDKP
jgi:hypothetical protein